MKQTKRTNNGARSNLAFMRLLVAILKTTAIATLFAAATVNADDRRRERHERRESHNYIIERQQAGAVSGVPTSRRIIGKREIDIYPDGSMFEKNNYVGNAKR